MSWMNHDKLEKNSILLLGFIIVTVLIGGIVEIVPLFRMETVIEPVEGVRPYTPLDLDGSNIYIREGCYNCHSQQVRPLRDEVVRYGHYSLAAESMYDHPFQWGSKRTGPDLARVGGKYSDRWHAEHLNDPRSVVPASIMPAYPWLSRPLDTGLLRDQLATLARLGVPYDETMIAQAVADARAQSAPDSDGAEGVRQRYGEAVALRAFDGDPETLTEMDALVAYLQSLGTLTRAPYEVLAGERQ